MIAVEHRLEAGISIVVGSTIVAAGDTLDVPCIEMQDTVFRYQAAPLLFFKKDATDLLDDLSVGTTDQRRTIAALRSWLAAHRSVRLTITGSSSSDEDAALAKKRILHVADLLEVQAQRVSIVARPSTIVPAHPQLLEEQRFVRIDLDGGDDVVDVDTLHSHRSYRPVSVNVVTTLVCEAGPCTIDTHAEVNGRTSPLQGDGEFKTLVLMPQQLQRETVEIAASSMVTDTDRRSQRAGTTALLRPTAVSTVRDTLFVLRHLSATSKNSVMIGYFGFDEGSFYAIDQEAVLAVKAARKKGKTITLYPGADDLGDPDHNAQLQRSRALAALRLLGLSERDVTIVIEPSTAASNATPMGRIANRSVRAVIGD